MPYAYGFGVQKAKVSSRAAFLREVLGDNPFPCRF